MKSKILLFTATSVLLMGSCKKTETDTKPKDFGELKTRVIYNFAEDVALPAYSDLNNSMLQLKAASENYYISGFSSDLVLLKAAWKNARVAWERTESFHFGPVKNGKYNSRMQTWPAKAADFDALLASSNPLDMPDVEKLSENFRGFHAMEYVMYGSNGNRPANDIDFRQRKYLFNLAKDLLNNSVALFNEWSAGSKNYGSEIIFAGNGGTTFKKKQDLFSVMVGGMNDLCSRLVTDNLGAPFYAVDSTIVESPYANLSIVDIKNNISSLKSVYTGRYKGSMGYGIKDLVLDKKASLDTKLTARMNAVDSAVSAIKMPLDSAIYFKKMEVKIAIDAVDSLRSTISTELIPFIKDNITD
jgi:putative iron-regulated protein